MGLMPRSEGRLLVYNREAHLEVCGELAVGDSFEAIRGNGVREGERMGTVTVVALEDDGPVLEVHLDDAAAA